MMNSAPLAVTGSTSTKLRTPAFAALKPGGVIVWVVADATIDGSETGTSFRHALGFMERGLKLHDTMIWQKVNPAPVVLPHRYIPAWDYMFVFCFRVTLKHSNLLTKPNVSAGKSRKVHSHRGEDRTGSFGDAPVKLRGTRHNVWAYKTGTNGKLYAPDFPNASQHTSIFPLALAKDHVLTWTNAGDLVIDPYGGGVVRYPVLRRTSAGTVSQLKSTNPTLISFIGAWRKKCSRSSGPARFRGGSNPVPFGVCYNRSANRR